MKSKKKKPKNDFEKLVECVKDGLRKMTYFTPWWCNYAAYWPAYYSFFRDVLGLKFKDDHDVEERLVKSCDCVVFGEKVIFVSERPIEIHRNSDGNRHCEDGPAIRYADGWSVYSLDAHDIPGWIIEHPEQITVEKIEGEGNAETKRIMMERFGYGKYLAETEAKVLDVSVLKKEYSETTRALMRTKDGQKWLVGSDGSTQRVYYMPVPESAKTCREAHEAISGLNEDQLLMEA